MAHPLVEAGGGGVVRLRVTGTESECEQAVDLLGEVFEMARVSTWMPMRADTTLGRIYAYVRPLPTGTVTAAERRSEVRQ